MSADRRRFLVSCSALALAPGLALAQQNQNPQRDVLLRELTRGTPVRTGRVVVDTPPLADNGHSVPLRIAVDSPMTAADHVRRITILAERNPRPLVASYALGPHSGRAEIATRIRIADIQDIVAVAEMSDGSFWMGSAHVIVTELACLEG